MNIIRHMHNYIMVYCHLNRLLLAAMPLFKHSLPTQIINFVIQDIFLEQEDTCDMLNQFLKGLTRRRNFDSTFNKDMFFYLLIIHRVKRYQP